MKLRTVLLILSVMNIWSLRALCASVRFDPLLSQIPQTAPLGKDADTARLSALIGFYVETLEAYQQRNSRLRLGKREVLGKLYSGFRSFRETDWSGREKSDGETLSVQKKALPASIRKILADIYSFLHSTPQKAYALRGDYQLRLIQDWPTLRQELRTMYLNSGSTTTGVREVPPEEYFIFQEAKGEVRLAQPPQPGSEILILGRTLGRCFWSLRDGDFHYDSKTQSVELPSGFQESSRPKAKVTCPGFVPHQLYWVYYLPQ